MPVISFHNDDPLSDGRQSERAINVRYGLIRLFFDLKFSVVPELTLSSGRRADLVALSPKGEIWIVEIKSSVEDFRSDQKWPDYRAFCDQFFFATHSGVPQDIFPEEAGFMLADKEGAAILRHAPIHALKGASRKAMLIRLARAAADRASRAELYSNEQANQIERQT